MPNWGSKNKGQQQAAASSSPTGTATGASQECPGCPPPVDPPGPGPGPTPPGPGPGPGPAPVDPPKPIPKIVRIEWLHGQDDEVLSGEGLHFVNLPVASKWVGASLAANKRRLGQKPGYKVWFDQPGSHSFKVKLLPAGGNASYTTTEKGRNGKFKADKAWHSHTTDADGTAVVKTGPQLTVAGGDKYSLEAHDDQAVIVKSSTIKTIRGVHVVQIKMQGLTAIAGSIADCIGEYARHHLKLVKLASVTMPHLHNVGTDTATLEANVATAWNGSQGKAKAPYALGVVFTDHLAVKNPNKTLNYPGQQVGPGKGPIALRIMGAGLTDPTVEERPLWRDIVPGEGWFISAWYTPNGGGAPIELHEPDVVPSQATGYSARVNVKVSHLPAGTGKITLTVNWVDRMRGGLSFGGSPTVLICTRAWWTDITAAEQNQTLVHELGHQFGMVPEGNGAELDAHADQYTDSGHVGSHCHHGVAAKANYGDSASNAASTCVIFGATNGKLKYCSLCAPQVRKVDLTPGW